MENYEELVLRIITFDSADIIITSDNDDIGVDL